MHKFLLVSRVRSPNDKIQKIEKTEQYAGHGTIANQQ